MSQSAAWLARKTGALDRPGGYKAHALATPLLGGLAVALGKFSTARVGLAGEFQNNMTANF